MYFAHVVVLSISSVRRNIVQMIPIPINRNDCLAVILAGTWPTPFALLCYYRCVPSISTSTCLPSVKEGGVCLAGVRPGLHEHGPGHNRGRLGCLHQVAFFLCPGTLLVGLHSPGRPHRSVCFLHSFFASPSRFGLMTVGLCFRPCWGTAALPTGFLACRHAGTSFGMFLPPSPAPVGQY